MSIENEVKKLTVAVIALTETLAASQGKINFPPLEAGEMKVKTIGEAIVEEAEKAIEEIEEVAEAPKKKRAPKKKVEEVVEEDDFASDDEEEDIVENVTVKECQKLARKLSQEDSDNEKIIKKQVNKLGATSMSGLAQKDLNGLFNFMGNL